MLKTMFKPGFLAGVIGGIVSIAVSVLLILALLIPGQAGLTLYCLSSPIGLLLSVGIGLLAAWLAQSRSPEKLNVNQAAMAGLIAGVVSTIVGLPSLALTQAMPNWLGLQEQMIEVQLMPSRMMGLSEEQLEIARAQIVAMQQNNTASGPMLAGIVGGLVCGTLLGAALSTGGGALGALIFKPARRKLVCEKCRVTFELGGNAFIEAGDAGSPDLVDYCTWGDFTREAARQRHELIAQALKTQDEGRQWQCSMCKAIQPYRQV
ncbi:MAG: hypothetical protein JW850_18390 [Thermoflexales bacterium]|nr:hypothetical protein [Thermoflexales bacterium]